VDKVVGDADYASVRAARNPMTHSRIPQNHYAGTVEPGPHELRSGFNVGPQGSEVRARQLVEMAVSLATRHVQDFIVQVVL